MKRGKVISFIRKTCALFAVCVCVFAAGYIFGVRQNVLGILSETRQSDVAANVTDGTFTAILSGRWIYVYDGTGALYDTVYVYTEYMTEDDKAALSDGLDFENEAEMRAFIEAFE
jgi:hypothetical protein